MTDVITVTGFEESFVVINELVFYVFGFVG